MFHNSPAYRQLRKMAQEGHPDQRTPEHHWYVTGQSLANPGRPAAYIRFSDDRLPDILVADYPTDQEARDATTALNRARPFEYSAVEAMIRYREDHHRPELQPKPHEDDQMRAQRMVELARLADSWHEKIARCRNLIQEPELARPTPTAEQLQGAAARMSDWEQGTNLILQSFPTTAQILQTRHFDH